MSTDEARTPVVFIMGAGVVGTALAAGLVRAGVPVAGLHGRQRDLVQNPERVPNLPRGAPTGKPVYAQRDLVQNPERVPNLPRGAPTGKPVYAQRDLVQNPERVPNLPRGAPTGKPVYAQRDLPATAGALAGVLASTGEIPPTLTTSDVVIISVRDERIPEVAARLVREQRLRKEQVVLHTSGAIAAAQALAVARTQVRAVGTLHPLLSFASARVAVQELKSVAFGIEGDQTAQEVAARLVRALGARAVFLDAETLPLYHAGAVLASNYVVALADMARGLLVKAGVPEDQALPALIPLLASVVQNLSQVGLPGALTGPVERGDVSSVERHLRILEARAPEMLDLYRLLGRDVLRLAREKSALEPAVVTRLELLFRADAASGTNGGRVSEAVKEPTREAMKEPGKET